MTDYKPQVWRVNVREQTLKHEPVPGSWKRLGGRGLLARILLDEVDAKCDPPGAGSKLIFAPGLLVGHMLSSTDRISVGGKSPLTGGIEESNAGGRTGLYMTHMGIHALIVEDLPKDDGYWVLNLSLNGARWEKADGLVGLGVYETAPKLIEKYGDKVAIALIGPGGEMRMKAAGIQNLDKDRVPSRIAARGGLGAVMGSKGLKAIIFDHAGGQKPPIADPEAFKAAHKDYTKAVMEHPPVHHLSRLWDGRDGAHVRWLRRTADAQFQHRSLRRCGRHQRQDHARFPARTRQALRSGSCLHGRLYH
jgi:aldehyde:ferredoxin oxidoreductase